MPFVGEDCGVIECRNCPLIEIADEEVDEWAECYNYPDEYDPPGEDDECDCISCRPARGSHDDSRPILNYSYKPTPEFRGRGPLYLGFELEISAADLWPDARHAQTQLGDLAYLKEDCSIRGSGFELVTHPMSYDWALANFPWDLLTELRERGCSGEGNGLHVHVSRKAFTPRSLTHRGREYHSPTHAYRWLKFMYRNQPEVVKLARRESDQWATFGDEERQHIAKFAKGQNYWQAQGEYYDSWEGRWRTGWQTRHPRRYSAVNVTNDDTFEVRVFASSLNPTEVQASLGLVAASVEYTKGITAHDVLKNNAWSWGSFAKFVNDDARFAPLYQEMEKHTCAC